MAINPFQEAQEVHIQALARRESSVANFFNALADLINSLKPLVDQAIKDQAKGRK